jgi:hypothetical protein
MHIINLKDQSAIRGITFWASIIKMMKKENENCTAWYLSWHLWLSSPHQQLPLLPVASHIR